jgi:antirestriction protein ArdC
LDDHVRALAEQMAEGKSDRLVRYLEFSARFHSYSFGNLLLILLQFPDATRVAGLRQWNKLGRHVRTGEKGIMILAPMTVRKRVEKETGSPTEIPARSHELDAEAAENRITLFKPVYVFDVSQTEGRELPTLLQATGDVSGCYPALQRAVRDAGIVLELVDSIPGSASAEGVSCGSRIAIRNDLDPPDAFRTLAHEFAHELLHWPKVGSPKEPNRAIRETEADAAAFVVCRHFDVTCDSADYLLLYDSDKRLLLERLETIRHTAATIIDTIKAAQGVMTESDERN